MALFIRRPPATTIRAITHIISLWRAPVLPSAAGAVDRDEVPTDGGLETWLDISGSITADAESVGGLSYGLELGLLLGTGEVSDYGQWTETVSDDPAVECPAAAACGVGRHTFG